MTDDPLAKYRTADITDGPPGPGEGRVTNVEEVTDAILVTSESRRDCHTCEADIWVADEDHVRAAVRLQKEIGHGTRYVYFCDQGCWYEWATA